MPLMDQPPLSKVPDPHYAVLAPGDQGIPMRGDPGDGTSMGDGARRLCRGPENIEPVSTGYATEPAGHARIYAGAAQRGQQGARYITTRSEAMEKVTSTGKGLRSTPGRGVWPGSAVNDVPVQCQGLVPEMGGLPDHVFRRCEHLGEFVRKPSLVQVIGQVTPQVAVLESQLGPPAAC